MADPANECFALRREDGSLTGEIKPRALVHRDGDLHGASHVFLARLRGGRAELLLQKRSAQKDSFPGLYDISAAGHLDPGEDFAAAARRELAEALGGARPTLDRWIANGWLEPCRVQISAGGDTLFAANAVREVLERFR